MKKNAFFIALAVLGGIVLSFPVMAATTASLSPASVSVVPGQSFNVAVGVDPQSVKNYTVKIELHFPADLLEVKSFVFSGSDWMAWNQAGYDLTDNTNGVLIKTAGYPKGFNSAAAFGTVTFFAKKAGSGTIQTASGSLTLDVNSQNVFSGSAQVSVTIAEAAAPPTQTPSAEGQITSPPVKTPSKPATTQPAPSQPPATETAEIPTQTEQVAAVAQAQSTPSPSPFAVIGNVGWQGWLILLIIISVIVLILLILRRRNGNGHNKNGLKI